MRFVLIEWFVSQELVQLATGLPSTRPSKCRRPLAALEGHEDRD